MYTPKIDPFQFRPTDKCQAKIDRLLQKAQMLSHKLDSLPEKETEYLKPILEDLFDFLEDIHNGFELVLETRIQLD